MKGHGREMIQFGLPIADAPAETENETGTSKGMSHLVQNFLHIYMCLVKMHADFSFLCNAKETLVLRPLDFVMNKFCRSKSRIHSCNAARAN
jgi:hypothetical protein